MPPGWTRSKLTDADDCSRGTFDFRLIEKTDPPFSSKVPENSNIIQALIKELRIQMGDGEHIVYHYMTYAQSHPILGEEEEEDGWMDGWILG